MAKLPSPFDAAEWIAARALAGDREQATEADELVDWYIRNGRQMPPSLFRWYQQHGKASQRGGRPRTEQQLGLIVSGIEAFERLHRSLEDKPDRERSAQALLEDPKHGGYSRREAALIVEYWRAQREAEGGR